MLPLFDIQQLFTRLLSDPDPAALLSDLDPLTLEMIHRMAKDHEGQLKYFHHLKFDKGGSQSGSLWHASTSEENAARLSDAIHVLVYDRPTIERHLVKLPKAEIALYYGYMWEAELFNPEKEFGTKTAAWVALADRHESTSNTMMTIKRYQNQRGRQKNATKEMVNRVKYFLPVELRQTAADDHDAMKV
jgi:hypothetical protein